MHIHQLNIQLQFPLFILSQVLVHMTDSRIEGKIDGRNWNDPIPDLQSISISEIQISNFEFFSKKIQIFVPVESSQQYDSGMKLTLTLTSEDCWVARAKRQEGNDIESKW